jgi:hypothetical protein
MHAILGHPAEQLGKAMAIHLGLKLTRTSQKCKNCAIRKAKKKGWSAALPKNATKKWGCLSIDIISLKEKSIRGAKLWLLEIGIISNEKTKRIKGKLDECGLPSLWVGYPTNHAEDIYKFMNPRKKKISISRNVIWLDNDYAEFKGITAINVEQITPIKVEQEAIEAKIDAEIIEVEDNVNVPAPTRTPAGWLSRELRGFMEYNKDPDPTGETTEVVMLSQAFGGKIFYEVTALISGFDDGSDEPKNCTEVSKH